MNVFISYARADATPLATDLRTRLLQDRHDVFLDTRNIQAGDVWSLELEQAIDRCDVLLALISPGSYDSEYCRAEVFRAFRKGRRVIPLLIDLASDWPLILETAHYLDFTSGFTEARYAELVPLLSTASAKLQPEFRATRTVEPFGAPPVLPAGLRIDRRDHVDALRNSLLSEQNQTVAITAVAGMGGIGKSVLASFLFHDEVIRQAFPGGIVWIPIGRERTLQLHDLYREIIKGLGDTRAYDNELAARNRYTQLLREQPALVILDDIWNIGDLDAFVTDSPRSRVLFTTRDASIARHRHASLYNLDRLDEAEALQLLANAAECELTDLPGAANALVKECGLLPLAIAQIGAVVQHAEPVVWDDTLDLMRHADIEAIRSQLPPGQDPYFKATEVSVQALDEPLQKKYRALAVLLEDQPAPAVILETLWEAKPAEARRTAKILSDRSLAQFVDGVLRLHDLQFDYLRALHTDRPSLELIHEALRLSAHVVDKDPHQFASQWTGRLLPYQNRDTIREFLDGLQKNAPRPWLRPLWPSLQPPGTALIRTLSGHLREVRALAVTPDGQHVVSGSHDKTLRMWDLESGSEILTLFGHTSRVNSVAVTTDGRRAVSASGDNSLKVWDLETGRLMKTLSGHSLGVRAVAVTPGDRLVVSGSADRTIKLWDLESAQEIRTFVGHTGLVRAIAVTPDGRRVVSASSDMTLKVWDLETGQVTHTLVGHSLDVLTVAVTPDGRAAVSGSADRTLKLWDLKTGREIRAFTGHAHWVRAVALTPDGRFVVSASADKTLKVWDLETAQQVRTLPRQSNAVLAVAVSSDGHRAISASWDRTLKVWNLASGNEFRGLNCHPTGVNAVAVTPDGSRAVSASRDGTLKLWDLEFGHQIRTLSGHSSSVDAVAVAPNGRRAVSASYDRTCMLWDLESGQVIRTLCGHAHGVRAVAVAPDGRFVISGSVDKTIKLWNLESGQEICTLSGHSGFVSAVAVTLDGRFLVSGAADKTLKLWNLESGRKIRTISGHSGFVSAVALTPDGRCAISASRDRTLRLWNLETGRELFVFSGHQNLVHAVAVTQNGRYAVSASHDQTIKVWDLQDGALVASFRCEATAYSCAVAPDGRILAGDSLGQLHYLVLEE